jgi:hypothetical protein
MQNNDQKGSLKDTFSEFGAAPTDGLWNAISEKLDEKKKRRFVFWWWSTGLAAVLVVGFMILNLNQPSGMDKTAGGRSYPVHAKTDSEKTTISQGGILANAGDSLTRKMPFMLVWDASMFPFNFTLMNGFYDQPFCGNLYAEQPWMNQLMMGDYYNNRSNDSLKKTESALAKNDSLLSTNSSSPTDSVIRAALTNTQLLLKYVPENWQIGLFAGRSFAIMQSNPLIEGKESITPESMTANPPVETRYSWNADLTVSKLIYRRWWLGSGVHFGFMQSGNIPETSNYKSGKVNYLSFGVPISIGRGFQIGRRFNITPMAGFRYDYAFRKTEEYTYKEPELSISSADAPPSYVKTTETARLNLFSTYLAAELSFRFRRNWALVAKPMTQFYVFGQTDETTPNTFRSAWFSGSVGVTKRF